MSIGKARPQWQENRLTKLLTVALRHAREHIPRPGIAAGHGPASEHSHPDCIFCRQDEPDINRIMCENRTFYARYDNFPANPGHVEIVPKRHVESFFDLSPEEIAEAYDLLRKARDRIVREVEPPHGYTIGVNEGEAAGQSIRHLHLHLIPRYHDDVKDPRGGIRQAAPNWDPDSWA
jgi:diadenosine tetraphosphate (Ap4A) HIT family hydrolase